MTQPPDKTSATHSEHCSPEEHAPRRLGPRPDRAFTGAVQLFKALADEQRLRTLELLSRGEACGSEIAATFDEPLSTVSHRMKLLETAGLVTRRREGRHVYFGLADDHVVHLVEDALDHALE
ncbi:MAG: metalloregulator ArsR/SmtB family transcription factor [Planctomycetota bacterium]